eukprot:GILK01032443.1.p1 GENE.GILK01032443.1~~GILK01032443.1.p1  ORF type:complete len:276 (+),score=57.68 GILK01032443.1:2-829(+)
MATSASGPRAKAELLPTSNNESTESLGIVEGTVVYISGELLQISAEVHAQPQPAVRTASKRSREEVKEEVIDRPDSPYAALMEYPKSELARMSFEATKKAATATIKAEEATATLASMSVSALRNLSDASARERELNRRIQTLKQEISWQKRENAKLGKKVQELMDEVLSLRTAIQIQNEESDDDDEGEEGEEEGEEFEEEEEVEEDSDDEDEDERMHGGVGEQAGTDTDDDEEADDDDEEVEEDEEGEEYEESNSDNSNNSYHSYSSEDSDSDYY